MTTTTFSPKEEKFIAKDLGIPLSKIETLVQNLDALYNVFPISRGKNKKRWITAPKRELKNIQHVILHQILYNAQAHDCAHGFVPKRSIVTNARPHVQKQWVANFDIHSFFPSTKAQVVFQSIQKNFNFSESFNVFLSRLLTLRGRLPQGAPTSPHLANLIMWEADTQLHKYSDEHDLTYTRYADDLTFSGDAIPRTIQNDISKILAPSGYMLSHTKSKILGQHKRQMVTGLVVNRKLNLPRPIRKKLRAIVHDISLNGIEHAMERSEIHLDQLLGYISLQNMWDPARAKQQIIELMEALKLA